MIDCNEWKTEKHQECTNMGKAKRLELWWQLYGTWLPEQDVRNIRPLDFYWTEGTIPITQKWLHPKTYTDAAICSVGALSTDNNDTLFVDIRSVSEYQSVHISSKYRQWRMQASAWKITASDRDRPTEWMTSWDRCDASIRDVTKNENRVYWGVLVLAWGAGIA